MWLDGCKIGLTVESEEGEVPHLRWSQAPPLPWRRPGSAVLYIYIYILCIILKHIEPVASHISRANILRTAYPEPHDSGSPQT